MKSPVVIVASLVLAAREIIKKWAVVLRTGLDDASGRSVKE